MQEFVSTVWVPVAMVAMILTCSQAAARLLGMSGLMWKSSFVFVFFLYVPGIATKGLLGPYLPWPALPVVQLLAVCAGGGQFIGTQANGDDGEPVGFVRGAKLTAATLMLMGCCLAVLWVFS